MLHSGRRGPGARAQDEPGRADLAPRASEDRALEQHLEDQEKHRAQLGTAYQDHGFVFAGQLGQPLHHQNLLNRHLLHSNDLGKFVQAALQEQRLGAMWVLALATGMRPEEYLGPFWTDFSLDFRKVTVNRALVRFVKPVEGEPSWRFEPPKTDKSRRTLSLEPEMAELLRQHRDQQDREKEYAGSAYDDLGLVLANELGGPLYLDNLRARSFKRVLKRAGLPSDLAVYSLRHSAASALLKDRESLKSSEPKCLATAQYA